MYTLSALDLTYEYKNRFQKVRAVNNISVGFEQGMLTVIVGRSGSGKSTLLSLLAGLDAPSGGKILLNDQDIQELNIGKYRREIVTMVYQSYNLLPLLTAEENVSLPLLLRNTPAKEAIDTARRKLELVGIDASLYRRLPSMLSGGEQQRVAIARALAGQYAFLLADEPTGNLDNENSANILRILTDIAHNENIGVIVVTHAGDIAEQADRIHTMQDGAFVAE